MKRIASSIWLNNLKNGHGSLTTRSGALSIAPYSYHTRFGDEIGTNPEELLSAALVSSYSMTLTMLIEKSRLIPDKIEVTATSTFEKRGLKFAVTEIHLDVVAQIPDADRVTLIAAVRKAKAICPILGVLHTMITVDARLV